MTYSGMEEKQDQRRPDNCISIMTVKFLNDESIEMI